MKLLVASTFIISKKKLLKAEIKSINNMHLSYPCTTTMQIKDWIFVRYTVICDNSWYKIMCYLFILSWLLWQLLVTINVHVHAVLRCMHALVFPMNHV